MDNPQRLIDHFALLPPVEFFQLGAAGINNRTAGVHSGSGDFILKTYQAHRDPAVLRYEHTLLRWLAEQRLPFGIPVPLLTHEGETVLAGEEGWQTLFPLLAGEQVNRTDALQVEVMGAALAELHTVLALHLQAARPNMGAYGDLAQVHPLITDPYHLTPAMLDLPDTALYNGYLAWWRAELAALAPFVQGPYRRLPWQVVHGDFDASNALFGNGTISGILDFEFAAPDARAIDVASGLFNLLRIWDNPASFALIEAFMRGYQDKGHLTDAEIEAIPDLIRLRNVTSSVWWFGRGLAAGTIRGEIERINDLQNRHGWLAHHDQALREAIRQAQSGGRGTEDGRPDKMGQITQRLPQPSQEKDKDDVYT